MLDGIFKSAYGSRVANMILSYYPYDLFPHRAIQNRPRKFRIKLDQFVIFIIYITSEKERER